MSAPLRLVAADAEDLAVVSAAVQDGLFKVADADWLPGLKRFTLRLQRYRWEEEAPGPGQRVWAALAFERVLAVRARKVAQTRRDALASLLSLGFEEADPPAGRVLLALADGGEIALDVECLDVLLVDLAEPRPAVARPDHERDPP